MVRTNKYCCETSTVMWTLDSLQINICQTRTGEERYQGSIPIVSNRTFLCTCVIHIAHCCRCGSSGNFLMACTVAWNLFTHVIWILPCCSCRLNFQCSGNTPSHSQFHSPRVSYCFSFSPRPLQSRQESGLLDGVPQTWPQTMSAISSLVFMARWACRKLSSFFLLPLPWRLAHELRRGISIRKCWSTSCILPCHSSRPPRRGGSWTAFPRTSVVLMTWCPDLWPRSSGPFCLSLVQCLRLLMPHQSFWLWSFLWESCIFLYR